MKRRSLVIELASVAALCALAGCAMPMQTVDASRAACASYGFQPGTDAFAECVQKEQHTHTLVFLGGNRTSGGGGDPLAVPSPLPPLPTAQAPAIELPPLPQPQTQFCFGSGAFEQCQ
jgi:hypothetical protein